MKSLRNIVLGALLAVSFLCGAAHAAMLRGQVVDAETGNPIADASITIAGSPSGSATNLDGRFQIDGLIEGEDIRLKVTRLNYVPLTLTAKPGGASVRVELEPIGIALGEVVIRQGRSVTEKTPGAFTAIGSGTVKESNSVVEPPFLAMRVPNATFFNWGGHTLGATHIRIRGFDSNRLTVSVNGIPINDPEDHNVYWQDTPDFLSNTHDVQVERGVSSFLTAPSGIGGGMNLSTSDVVATRQTELGLYWGDYNTRRRTFLYRSGLVDEKYNFTGRFSRASSDGYRDHSAVDEWSYFLAATRYDENSVHTLNVYGGQEVSDLSFTAIAQSVIDTNRTWTPEANHGVGWDGERDDFQQPHYILRSKWRVSPSFEVEEALYWIEGSGYYEQYRGRQNLKDYGLKYLDINDDGVIDTVHADVTDLIRRKHVDKTQFGWLPKVNWKLSAETEVNAGLELRLYTSDHTNRVMWARNIPVGISPQHAYNTWDMTKDYLGFSGNVSHKMTPQLSVNGGVEIRQINQSIDQGRMGTYQGYRFQRGWVFVNPRAGVNLALNEQSSLYASVAMAGREPFVSQELNADNPKDTVKTIDPEQMTDVELGVRHRVGAIEFGANVYALFFTNEITYTGRWDGTTEELQFVNAPTSRHLGIEFDLVWATPVEGLKVSGDLGLDRSTFGAFKYNYIDEIGANWSPVQSAVNVEGNPIPMTPNFVFNLRGRFDAGGLNAELAVHSVARQYLDPLGDEEWSLDPYSLLNATLGYHFKAYGLGCRLSLNVLNLLDSEYNGFGWTETVWPDSDANGNPLAPLSGRYFPMYIPAMGRMVVGGLRIEF